MRGFRKHILLVEDDVGSQTLRKPITETKLRRFWYGHWPAGERRQAPWPG